jgi:hypothetical protein
MGARGFGYGEPERAGALLVPGVWSLSSQSINNFIFLIHVFRRKCMSNPISSELNTGTIGELLVQLRLLQFGVQAAQPLKDSGNDLIAVKGDIFRSIQVKTTQGRLPSWPAEHKLYHILAVVRLKRDQDECVLDQSAVYLLTREDVEQVERAWSSMADFQLTRDRIDTLFGS